MHQFESKNPVSSDGPVKQAVKCFLPCHQAEFALTRTLYYSLVQCKIIHCSSSKIQFCKKVKVMFSQLKVQIQVLTCYGPWLVVNLIYQEVS